MDGTAPAFALRMSDHPLFAALAPYRDLLASQDLDRMSHLLAEQAGAPLHFVPQTASLLEDGLHYERRIAELGLIATRPSNTHDLFNAAIWLQHSAIKRAMNRRQAADITRVGPKQRTRGQCALTHFDEAGAIVWLADRELVDAWDAHDWPRLFLRHRDAWGRGIAVTVIGHALLDYALVHDTAPVAKALAVAVSGGEIAHRCAGSAVIASWPEAERAIAADIDAARRLADPQELRPLPLAGIPGWSGVEQSETFYASAPCFRPLRAGRRYPPPLAFGEAMM